MDNGRRIKKYGEEPLGIAGGCPAVLGLRSAVIDLSGR